MSRAPASRGGRSRAAEEEQSRREGRSRAEDVPWASPRRGSRKQAARASGPRARWSVARDEPGVRSPGSRGSSSGSGDPAGGREMEARTGTTSSNSNGGGGGHQLLCFPLFHFPYPSSLSFRAAPAGANFSRPCAPACAHSRSRAAAPRKSVNPAARPPPRRLARLRAASSPPQRRLFPPRRRRRLGARLPPRPRGHPPPSD